MKTLHIITGLSSGGAERALYNVLYGGLARQFDSAVVSLSDGGVYGSRLRALGVPVYELGIRGSLPGPVAIIRLTALIRKYRPDAIQGWMYHGNLAASLAATLAPQKLAVAWNIRQSLYHLSTDRPLTRHVIRGNRLLSNRPNAIIYNSYLSRSQHETLGIASTTSVVIPNGFDTEALAPTQALRTAARQIAGIEKNELVVGHVARCHPMKDHVGFLHAALRVLDRRPETRFLLLGKNVSSENPALADIVPDHFAERFIFMDERPDVHQMIQAMDVLCLSSAWGEAFPNVLGEAMASGVPCVTTDVGDSADIVGDTGVVVPPSDSQALAQGLLTMLTKTNNERRALGIASRERVKASYGLDSIVGQYALLYQGLMAKESRRNDKAKANNRGDD